MQPLYATAYGNGRQPLYATLLSYPRQYATAYGNGRQPLYATLLSYPRQYATALCNLAKLPKTICNRFRQPLMEMAGNRFMQPC
jgi:hypothetical protein